MEEEKASLRLDVDIQKLEANRLKKEKRKAEEDLDSLKTDYKKLRLSTRATGLGKTSEQWRQEIQEEKIKAGKWEGRFQEAHMQNRSLKKSLLENQDERDKLKPRVAELEKTVR
ncbi:hypothetical protein Gotur_025404 [Gossypium turneri]